MRLGLRELVRSPGRFAPVGAAVTLLVILVLVFAGVGSRHVDDLNGAVARSSADVLVLSTGAQGSIQASRVSAEDVHAVARVAGVGAAAPVGEVRVGGIVDDTLRDVSLWGVVPGGPGTPELVEGRAPRALGEAVVDVADRALGFDLGARVEIADTGHTVQVVGLTEGRRFASIPTVTVTYPQWEAVVDAIFADADDVEPTMIAVDAGPGVPVEQVVAAIGMLDRDLVANAAPQLAAGLPGVAGVRASFAVATIVGLLAVSAVVGLFFLLITALRQDTLTMLRAVGVPARSLTAALVTQVVTIVLGAALVGGVVVAVAAAVAPPRLPLEMSPRLLATVTAAALAVAVVATVGAVRRLRAIDPAEALVGGA